MGADEETRRVLVVADDPEQARAAVEAVEAEGLQAEWERDADGVRRALARGVFSLVLLGLSPADTLDLCQEVRAQDSLPIVAVAPAFSEADYVHALRAGADDYLTQPLSRAILGARVGALLRRRELDRSAATPVERRLGDLVLDVSGQTVQVDGRTAQLTRSEFDVLSLLAETPGVTRTRAEIMARLWRTDHAVQGRACDLHILHLRRKIERDPQHPRRIVTVRMRGYRLDV